MIGRGKEQDPFKNEILPIPNSLPKFESELDRRLALVLFYGEFLTLILTMLFGGGFIAFDPSPRIVVLVNVMFVLEIASFIQLLLGRMRVSMNLFIFSIWATLSYAIAVSGGISSPAIGMLGFVIVISAIFQGWHGAVTYSALSLVTLFVLFLFETNDMLIISTYQPTLVVRFFLNAAFLIASGLLLVFYERIFFGEQKKTQQAEAALELERDRLGLAIRASGMGFWDLDLDSRILTIDGRWLEHIGYEKEAAKIDQQEWETYIHPQDRPYIEEKLNSMSQDQLMFEHEFRHRMADGSWRWVMTRGQLVESTNHGSKPTVIGVHTDIHERKLVEEALTASKQELESVLQNTPVVLWRVDADGRFTLAKGQGLHVFELSPDKLPGMTIAEVREISPTWADQITLALEKQAQEGEVRVGDASFTSRSMPQFDLDGRLIGAIGVAVDITPQKQVENQLQKANRELETANIILQETQERAVQQGRLAAVGQLAAGIAHDFNNALLPITLYAEMLLGDQSISDSMRERLETVLSQAQRAASLTQQILDFGRKSLMQPQCIKLRPFLERFINMLRRTLPESIHIKLVTHGGQYLIWADESRIEQMLMNLAINARDSMEAGGELTFELVHQIVEEPLPQYPSLSPGEWICLKVKDTGEGIPAHILPRIFEPFFTTKKDGTGSGLGLAQVYGIVKQHNGYVYAESEDNAGACFSIWFPQVEEECTGQADLHASNVDEGSGERIVVVEDNPVTRAALVDVLELLDYHVVMARDAKEALDVYRSEEVDLVLSDMVMPDMSGVELYKQLRELNPEVRMLIVTGYPLGSEKQEMLALGICGFIQKPLDMNRIQTAIREALPV